MKRILFSPLLSVLAFLLLTVTVSLAEPISMIVTGRVVDTAGAVLQGAHVELRPAGGATVTNSQGEFFFTNIPSGSYKLTVSYVGFAPYEYEMNLKDGGTTNVAVIMKVAEASQEIVVTAERVHGEAEAINRSREADNIVQVLPAEVITSLPNANIADALGRLPSVTVERDEGESKYVQIRGTEPRLNNVTVDGISIPSPEPGVRQIKLDALASDLVDSVEINKTLQANMDGDGIGGSVNLQTKMAEEAPSVSLYGNGGYTPIANGRHADQFGGTISKRWGAQKKLGTLFGGTYDYNGRGIDDMEPSPTVYAISDNPTMVNGLPVAHYESMDMREYLYNRTRWGFAGSVDYKLDEGSNLYLRGFFSDFQDYGHKWVFSLNDAANPKASQDWRTPDYVVANIVAGGKHQFKSSWLSWDAAVSRSRQLASGGTGSAKYKWAGDSSVATACFNDQTVATSVYRPGWSSGCFTPGTGNATDIRNYKLTTFVLPSTGQSPDLALTGSASYGKQYHVGNRYGTIEVGGKFRTHHKFDNSMQAEWDGSELVANHPEWISSFTNSNYYDKTYHFTAVPDYGSVLAWAKANGGFSVSNGSGSPNSGNFNLVERVSSGYVMNTLDLTSRMHLVAGLRVEATHVDGMGFDSTTNLVNQHVSQDYIDLLPSAALRYSLTQDAGLRFVYSRGLTRPNPQALVQTTSLPDTSQVPNTITLGNTKLHAQYADNIDVLYEHYLKPLGMVQAGYFYKHISDPQVQGQLFVDPTHYGLPSVASGGSPLLASQWRNVQAADLMGFEVGFQQHLTYLPGVLRNSGLAANYSWTTSQMNGLAALLRDDHPAMLRQAPHTWNVSPTYDTKKFSMRVGMTYNSAMIFAYQYQDLVTTSSGALASTGTAAAAGGAKGPGGDNYLYPHFQFDAQASYKLSRSLTVYGYGLNLTNEAFGFYNGSPQYVVQREYYHPTYAGGLKFNFTRE